MDPGEESEAPTTDRLAQVERVVGLVLAGVTVVYFLWPSLVTDEAQRRILGARAVRLWRRVFGCCAPCRAQRAAERQVVWEAMIVTGQVPGAPS